MFRMSFDSGQAETVKKTISSTFMHMHACVASLQAYTPTIHTYASMFISSYERMPQYAWLVCAYTGSLHAYTSMFITHTLVCVHMQGPYVRTHKPCVRMLALKNFIFVQFDFFFFTYFLIQHDSYSPFLVFHRLYLPSVARVALVASLHSIRP